EAKGKKVLVELKNKQVLSGTLIAFDIHINIVLDDVTEMEDGQPKRQLGRVFVRGDTIITISPGE
ncbi:small nuclear ribonucleoprotein, partial [Nanoarchaeota archaeon]